MQNRRYDIGWIWSDCALCEADQNVEAVPFFSIQNKALNAVIKYTLKWRSQEPTDRRFWGARRNLRETYCSPIALCPWWAVNRAQTNSAVLCRKPKTVRPPLFEVCHAAPISNSYLITLFYSYLEGQMFSNSGAFWIRAVYCMLRWILWFWKFGRK